MGVFGWCSRRAGGLSIIALLTLCYWVISRESTVRQHRYKYEQPDKQGTYYSSTTTQGAGIWTYIFAYYCLFIHLWVSAVPVRACWGVWYFINVLKRSAQSKSLCELKRIALKRTGSESSIASSETLMSSSNGCSSTTTEFGDADPELYLDGGLQSRDDIVHAIIIPNYKEDIDTLRETLDVLACHPQASLCYDVCLAMEQREVNGKEKALGLIQEFVKRFRSIECTIHPIDIPGEAAGKGSNVAWAARKLSTKYSMEVRKNVIVTSIDADSHLMADYFSLLTNMHLAYPETASTTLYAAPIIFDRNAHKVAAIVRVADVLWAAAGISGLYSGSTVAPPTSVYSLPLDLVDRVGGWDCDGEAIGEDLHMYLKCFFALNGNLTSRTINSPVSQSNVTGGSEKGLRGIYADMQARYKQALRHMWGALDSGYAMRKLVELWQDRKHTTRAYKPLHCAYGDNSDLYIPESQLNEEETAEGGKNGIFSNITQDSVKSPNWEVIFYLFHRLFEAHFLPIHMFILVAASMLYVQVTQGQDDPHGLAWVFKALEIARIYGFFQFAAYIFLYESYHRLCVTSREKEMTRAGLAEGMDFSRRSPRNYLDYLLIPLMAPAYGTFPSIHAQVMHFWTLDLVYTVSQKATRRKAPETRVEDMA